MKKLIIFSLLLLTFSFPISIITNSGEFFTGQVIEENDEYITLMGDSSVYEILKEEIKEKVITFDVESPVMKREYGNRKGLRFSFASGLGEQIPVNDPYTYSDGSTKDVYINQISDFGVHYYVDLPQDYSVEFGVGLLNRMANISAKSSRNQFTSNYLSFTVRKMIFSSLNGGYHFNVGIGASMYSNSKMKAHYAPTDYNISYKDTLGYHVLVETWSNMPRVWIFDDLNFVMGLRWNFGAIFEATGTGYPQEWNLIGLNGFLFSTSFAFLW